MPPISTVSVIIPTYNRKASLLRTLESLKRQTFPMDRLEVIVVDDGSTDDTPSVSSQSFPFALRVVRRENQGATAARNYGVTISQAEILVFIDDDIAISPHTLEALVENFRQKARILVMGTLNKRGSAEGSVYTPIALGMAGSSLRAHDDLDFPFIDCNSELLACRRDHFLELGMFQDPTDGCGWPNWDDVDFGYRAHLNGFRILGASKAVAEHWDAAILDRVRACQRYFRAGRSAVWLFAKHPELKTLIPMLQDKTPPAWGQDPPRIIARKLARSVVSARPTLWGLERLASLMEQYYRSPTLLRRLYDLLHGAYLFQGYRKGMRDHAWQGT